MVRTKQTSSRSDGRRFPERVADFLHRWSSVQSTIESGIQEQEPKQKMLHEIQHCLVMVRDNKVEELSDALLSDTDEYDDLKDLGLELYDLQDDLRAHREPTERLDCAMASVNKLLETARTLRKLIVDLQVLLSKGLVEEALDLYQSCSIDDNIIYDIGEQLDELQRPPEMQKILLFLDDLQRRVSDGLPGDAISALHRFLEGTPSYLAHLGDLVCLEDCSKESEYQRQLGLVLAEMQRHISERSTINAISALQTFYISIEMEWTPKDEIELGEQPDIQESMQSFLERMQQWMNKGSIWDVLLALDKLRTLDMEKLCRYLQDADSEGRVQTALGSDSKPLGQDLTNVEGEPSDLVEPVPDRGTEDQGAYSQPYEDLTLGKRKRNAEAVAGLGHGRKLQRKA